ncbi:hypothetical protein H6P81_001511 [Aristolochia fimbriata]|uniref:Ycf15 n=1 Tax=Aristolochia fimbriata TaxID=158543 RepID=A0AAV7F7Q8_ARIFI|nr:hypothetical protein H6P81_001511 [Aristolochia fimbriata]
MKLERKNQVAICFHQVPTGNFFRGRRGTLADSVTRYLRMPESFDTTKRQSMFLQQVQLWIGLWTSCGLWTCRLPRPWD